MPQQFFDPGQTKEEGNCQLEICTALHVRELYHTCAEHVLVTGQYLSACDIFV